MFSSKNKAAHIKFESNRAMHDGGGMYVENKGENSACANDPALREFIISKKGIKNICQFDIIEGNLDRAPFVNN